MSRFFKPYEGSRPFIFISYAHRQSEAVVSTIRILHEKGYRLWYDEGIPAGSDWPANIAQHMQNCERVVFFLSERAMESPNCYSEMRTAFRLGKPILNVRLEDTPTPDNWLDLLAGQPEIPILKTSEERAEAILNSKFLPRRFHRSRFENVSLRAFGLAASLLFFLAAAGVLAALATGRWTPVTHNSDPVQQSSALKTEQPTVQIVELGEAERFFAVSFPDSQQERAVRRALSIPSGEVFRWQLSEIKELYFCGNMFTDSLDNMSFDDEGICRVNGAPVITGAVSDLSLFENTVRLEKLALVCQPLEDISSLSGLQLLQELSIAGSSVTDIRPLKDLPSLNILHLEHTEIADLSSLEDLPMLETVTVSREMLPLKWNESAGFKVILTE